MIFTREILTLISTWGVNLLFWFALIPQVIRNHKLRSTNGLSDTMIWLLFTGYLSNVLYAHCLNLPLAYKIMMPASLVVVAVMVIQRFAYTRTVRKNKMLLSMYVLSMVAASVLWILAPMYQRLIGNIAGWVCVCIWSSYQLPQVLKIQREKSVVGFSFFLPLCIGIAEMFEFVSAIILKLPVQTICNDVRGIAIFMIFCIQFLVFRKSTMPFKKNGRRSFKPVRFHSARCPHYTQGER